jgi:hypothetical protein
MGKTGRGFLAPAKALPSGLPAAQRAAEDRKRKRAGLLGN